jgi:preprotein translocase subunit SecY
MSPSSSGHVNMMKGQPFHVKYREIIRRMMFLIGALLVFRLGAHIPVPGINNAALENLFNANQGTILGLFNMFSGGALERMSILALGIMPYISASIIVQLMSTVIPSLEALKKEGEQGKRKINQYTRQGTLFLALVQAIGMCAGLISQGITLTAGLAFYVPAVTSLVAGTMFLMWLGEQINERGIGNGISVLIFVGIVAGLPTAMGQTFEQARQGEINSLGLIIILAIVVVVTAFVVFMERGQRRIVVNYAQRQQGRKMYQAQSSHLPLKVNMAGVIPAIFASSIILFPGTIAQWVGQGNEDMLWLQSFAQQMQPGNPLYILLYGAGIMFFCFFYTALVYNPRDTADQLKKSGAFIPGIRPGEQTSKYVDKVMTRLTLVGALYITAVCLLPEFLILIFNVPFQFGGTSLLIIVVVIMDFMSQVQAHLISRDYDSVLKKANFKNYGSSGIR